jgi:uncharacterized protein YrrD
VEDLGAPSSYRALEEGTPVYSSDGERIAEVEHVLADYDTDIFDGLVVDAGAAPGGHRFVDAAQIDEIYERGVVLTVAAADSGSLPEPSANPPAMEVTGEDFAEREGDDELEAKLKRAWDRISGKG